MTTYCTNADLVLNNGKSVTDFMLQSLTTAEKTTRQDEARTRAYNLINDTYLRGRTAIPATHISELEQIEVDLVVADILSGAFTGQTSNVSEWAKEYRDRAEDNLKNLRFDSSAEAATANGENTGNGTVTITTHDEFTLTELWILRCGSTGKFTAHGSLSGYLPGDITVGTQYPEKDFTTGLGDYGILKPRLRYEEYPISILITAGAVDFVKNDKFTFMTFASSYYRGQAGLGWMKRG